MDFELPSADTLSTELVPVQTSYLHSVVSGILKKLEFQDSEIKRLNFANDRIEGVERDITALQEGMLGLEEAMRKREMSDDMYCTKSAVRTMIDAERQVTDKDIETVEGRIREVELKIDEPNLDTQALSDLYSLFDLSKDDAHTAVQSQQSFRVKALHDLPSFTKLADPLQSQIDELNSRFSLRPQTPVQTFRPKTDNGLENRINELEKLTKSFNDKFALKGSHQTHGEHGGNQNAGHQHVGYGDHSAYSTHEGHHPHGTGVRSDYGEDSEKTKRVQFEDVSDEGEKETQPSVTLVDINGVRERISGLENEARSLQQQIQLQKQNRFPYGEVSDRLQILEDQYNRVERLKANRSELHKASRQASAEVEHRTSINFHHSDDGTGLLRYKCLSCKGPADKHEDILVPGPSRVFPPGTVLVSSPTSKAYLEWSSRVPSPSRRPKTADSRQSEIVQVVVKETGPPSTPSPPKNEKLQVRTRILGTDKKVYQGSLGDSSEVGEVMRPATAPSPVPQPQ